MTVPALCLILKAGWRIRKKDFAQKDLPLSKPPQKKRTRTLTTSHQSAMLHALLAQSRFLTTVMRKEVGRAIGLSARQVQGETGILYFHASQPHPSYLPTHPYTPSAYTSPPGLPLGLRGPGVTGHRGTPRCPQETPPVSPSVGFTPSHCMRHKFLRQSPSPPGMYKLGGRSW
ncbi:hypothetical protein BDP27DRAFT_1434274 [Rhodocollybia butyracea]|uniref:Uncharacterized protein n=1 Tax=Rhodocollybia butyracea TaxID=206335 RepID=A0A9P5P700_9AGAR|nr:hypothetical protein BDP27DRAFT_1434274 [Rhodocollybia butyracea]